MRKEEVIDMNEEVIEIISLLIKRMLNDEELVLEEEELIQELIDEGYDIKDIDKAFELIYNDTDIIEAENIETDNLENLKYYNRIFTMAEKMYLPLNIQGLLIKLISSNLLSNKENEEIIIKAIKNSYVGGISPINLWNIVEEVVSDESKLGLITVKITEFKNMVPGDFKYIN